MAISAPETETDFANLALDLLGQNAPLLSLDSDPSSTGKTLRRAFWKSWDETLRSAPWKCARKRVAIAALVETPAWGYDYYYQLPSDYVNMQEIGELGEGQQWVIETTDGGVQAIAVDLEAPLNIAYTYRLRDLTRADALFTGAFAAHLAASTARAITKSDDIEFRCWQVFDRKIAQALMADGRDRARPRAPESELVTTRD